jgi:hypothetical protein
MALEKNAHTHSRGKNAIFTPSSWLITMKNALKWWLSMSRGVRDKESTSGFELTLNHFSSLLSWWSSIVGDYVV